MTARIKNIPALRFKGFEQPWKLRKLDDVTEKVNSGKTPLGGQSVYVSAGVLFIRSQNVLDCILSFDNSTYITEEVNSTMLNSVVKANDILLNITGASLGRSCVVPKDFTIGNVNQHVCIVRLNKENDPYFLQPIFASEKGQNLFTSLQTGSGREGLNFQSIKKITLSFPSLPEQQKIASFLSAIDEKIRQLTRRKELLEQYKKGVMQQLFSGKLRFKVEKGKAYPKWEEKRVKDFVLEKKGAMKIGPFGSQLKKSTFVSTGYKVYGQENIFLNDFSFGERFISATHFNNLKANELHPGDFVISTMGTIGKCSIVPAEIQKGIMDSHMIRLQLHKDIILPNYLSQVFSSHLIQKQVKRFSVGGIMDGLSMGIINKLRFSIPPNIAEQQKIATFLSSLDTKIESVTSQIERTQGYKKGLLQKMFV